LKVKEIINEQIINEVPLPPDWDPNKFEPNVDFRDRLAYATARSTTLGAGSSRVAVEINYQNRPTVLKIAKNDVGLSQNELETRVLSDLNSKILAFLYL